MWCCTTLVPVIVASLIQVAVSLAVPLVVCALMPLMA
jgi:hypothetical protein